MKTILILAAGALCVFSAKADDDYATIVRYLGENGHYIISPDDVAKVQAFMKANGCQHVWEIPKGAFAAGDSVARPPAAEAAPSDAPVTHIVVPSGSPEENKDAPPVPVRVPGDVVDNALAYSKTLIPFLKTHQIPGRIQEERALSLLRLLWQAAKSEGYTDLEEERFTKIVLRELESAGVVDAYGNQ